MSTSEVNKKSSQAGYLFREAEVAIASETVDKSMGFVSYGVKNLYPQWLYKLVYESPIHGGIIGQKVQFIIGDGVEVVGSLAAKNDEIIDNGNSTYNLNETISEAALDLEVLAYYYLLFKKGTDGIWRVNPLSGELIRPNESMTVFHYSENWESKPSEKTKHRTYKSIFYANLEEDTECVMYVKLPSKQIILENGKLTSSIFPIQPYSGALPSILADIEMNYFHYAEVVNGWTSNTILNMNDGVPEDDDKKRILKEIKDQTTDRKKKGGMTVFFNDGVERAATILNIGGNNNDTRYLLTQEHGISTIMIGHSVQNTALFGLEVAGKLGGSSEVPEAFKRFMGTYVKNKRNIILESIVYGLETLNKWEGLEIQFKAWIPNWVEELAVVDNELLDALNKMSPLLATKVLSNLTQNEIRTKIGGVLPIEGGDVIKSDIAAFKSEDPTNEEIFSHFQKVGVPIEGLKFVDSRPFDYKSKDEDYISEFTNQSFAVELTPDQSKILGMIKGGESYGAIVKAIDKGAAYVSKALLSLAKNGFVKDWELTTKGTQSVTTGETLRVLYTYEKRPELEGAAILPDGRTRPFCETLINMNKAYTRAEIDQISGAIGRDVWLYRGGWYHNPDTEKNTPSCRHYWNQNITTN